MQLLNYAEFGHLPEKYDASEQKDLLVPLRKLISEAKDSAQFDPPITFEVIPALLKKPENTKTRMFLNPYDLSDWLPNSFMTYRNLISMR